MASMLQRLHNFTHPEFTQGRPEGQETSFQATEYKLRSRPGTIREGARG